MRAAVQNIIPHRPPGKWLRDITRTAQAVLISPGVLAVESPSLLANYLSESQLAAEFKKTRRTLQLWRQQRTGPAVTLIGREVYYSRDAVKAWLASLERPMPRAAKKAVRRRRG
jgi:hypothetical protein